jgi:polysaccharide deacetylase family protein (PEP-CTERM system associated)
VSLRSPLVTHSGSPPDARTGQLNVLTVDVEDYYQVQGFADVVRREDWPNWESRVEANTNRLLALFARHGARATFFVLGWIAERNPALVREIAAAGHEVACHGFDHQLIYRQTPAEFRQDLRRARQALEQALGERVHGYRAPCFSITTASLWALDVLIEAGFSYDSSIFPIYHHRYGMPGARRFAHTIRRPGGSIVELPPSTVALGQLNLPLGSGGYFRLLPYALFRRGLRHLNAREGQAAVLLVHPWEIDPHQPFVSGSWLNVWRHRLNLRRTLPRLEQLLHDFRFASAREYLAGARLLSEPNPAPESA